MAEIREAELSCPRCKTTMERGFISGGRGPVRWVTEPAENKTIFGGDHLVKQHWVWGRHVLSAARCERCRIGVFTYEST